MSDVILNEFLARPRVSNSGLSPRRAGQSLCFIIDQSRQPEALMRLYDLGQPIEQDNLFRSTEFESLTDKGPIWLSAPESSELKSLAAQLCLERHAGIALLTDDLPAALDHARWLLKVNDGSGGQSMLNYYRPSLWAALAITSGQHLGRLTGPWSSVFSPATRHFGGLPDQWIAWHSDTNSAPDNYQTRFNLPQGCAALQKRLGWVHWVDEQYPAFGSPSQNQLPGIADNLDTLVKHRITQGRHLLRLSQLVVGPPLDQITQAMAILQSKEASFRKVEQLERLDLEPISNTANVKDEWSHHGTW